MRVLDGERTLVRIFAGEADRYARRPLARALLERDRRKGAGVEVPGTEVWLQQ